MAQAFAASSLWPVSHFAVLERKTVAGGRDKIDHPDRTAWLAIHFGASLGLFKGLEQLFSPKSTSPSVGVTRQ
jgi:hypothetical protein